MSLKKSQKWPKFVAGPQILNAPYFVYSRLPDRNFFPCRSAVLVCCAHVCCVLRFFVLCVEKFRSSNTKIVSFWSFGSRIEHEKTDRCTDSNFRSQQATFQKNPLFCSKNLKNEKTRSIERHFSLFPYRQQFKTHVSVQFFVKKTFFRSTKH